MSEERTTLVTGAYWERLSHYLYARFPECFRGQDNCVKVESE
jgi:hypothetical protein